MRPYCILGLTVALLAFVFVPPVASQPHGTDLLVSHYNGRIYRVTLSGRITTLADYGPGTIWAMTWDVDNRHLLAAHITPQSSYQGEILRIDATSGAAATLIPATGLVTTIEVDQNGDYLLSAPVPSRNPGTVMRVKRGTTKLLTIRAGFPSLPAFFRERSTGDWLCGATVRVLERYTPDWSQRIASVPHICGYSYEFVQDPHTLDVYVGSSDFYHFDPRTNQATPINLTMPTSVGARGVAIDRAPGTGGGMVYVNDSNQGASRIFQYDRNRQRLKTIASLPERVTSMMFDRSRNLATVRQALPNDRLIRLSFPGDGGKAYALAIGLSGYTMGLSLPDGRVIPLTFDSLAGLTARGPLPPFLTGNHGFLSPAGDAVARLDFNALGGSVRGVRVWAVAVVLDPQAPLAIGTISKPILLVLD